MKARAVSIVTAGLIALFLAAIAFRAYATAQGVPLLAVDSTVFLPQTVPFRQTGELINSVWSGVAKLDSSGQGRMIYHGFLFPMTLSLLMWRSDYLALAAALSILHAVATLLPALMFVSLMWRWQWKMSSAKLLLVLLMVAAGANYTQGALGRPEPLAAIFLATAVCVMALSSFRWHGMIAGVGIGLVAASDPLVSVLAGLIFTGYAAWRLPWKQCLREIAITAAMSIFAFAACFCFYPYSFRDWLLGTWRLGNYALEQGVLFWPSFFRDYMARGSSWLLAGSIALVIWSGVRILRRNHRAGAGAKAPMILFATLILALVAGGRFVLYTSWARYTLLPFMPLGFIAVFHELVRAPETSQSKFARYHLIALTILVIATLGFIADLFERAHILRHGMTLPRAREKFQTLRRDYPHTSIALSRSLFTFTEDRTGIIFISRNSAPPANADICLMPQAYSGSRQPPALEGFRLAENYFSPHPVSTLGIPWWTGDRSCGFAVYFRENKGEHSP